MPPSPNYYELLEVEFSADATRIKAAYRRLARKYHPDMNPGDADAERRFKQIGEAYGVLSDPAKRLVYDQGLGLSQAMRQQRKASETKADPKAEDRAKPSGDGKGRKATEPPPKPSDSGGQGGFDVNGTRFRDMFDALFRKVEKPAQGDGAAAERTTAKAPPPPPKSAGAGPKRGEDVTVETYISREEAENGVVKTVNVQHTEVCKRCSGTGRVNGIICTVCRGERQLVTLRKIDVRVPAKVKPGSKVRVAKEGGRGVNGGDPGDLFLLIRIEEDRALKIDGVNVNCEVSLRVTEAVLGTEIEVPTVGGKVKMVVPPRTSSGAVFRLKGQGVTLNGVTGDQFVTVQIVVPKDLTPEEVALYEQLAKLQRP